MIDGLSRSGVIRRITLPLSLAALASGSLYVFMMMIARAERFMVQGLTAGSVEG
jgi:ABC-type maltose transport system permease subunit